VLLGATAVEEKFFKKLGGWLISSVQTPEEAIDVILKRFEYADAQGMQGPQPWGRF
jgi:hypothetical protein